MTDTKALRDEAYRTATDLDERVHTVKALEGAILRLSRHVMDLADDLDAALDVAHRAWHLLDESGESNQSDDNGAPVHIFFDVDYKRLSSALDALEAHGWDPHLAQEPTMTASVTSRLLKASY